MRIPKLRFPGFADEWQEYSMGELYTERKEPGNESLPMLTVSIHSGVSDGELDEENLGKAVRRSEDKTTYKHVHAGDLVFNMMRAWQGAIGCTKNEGMISPAYISAEPDQKVYPPFMDYYVKRKEMIEQINSLSYGVTDFRKRLYWDSFVKVKCMLPTEKEQQKIAGFLSSVDEVIAASESEVQNLEAQKKAVTKKIFSQEVRFKKDDGTDFPEWEFKQMEDVISLISGQDYPPEQYNDYGLGIPYLTGASCIEAGKTTAVRWTETPKNIVIYQDIVIVCKGSGSGTVAIVDQKEAHIARQFMCIRPKPILNREYCYHQVCNMTYDIRAEARGTIPGIDRMTILQRKIGVPCLEEQRLIANFLSNFDEAIAAAKKELGLWKELKKGLLQQMFV